jgi:hypothetical protein
MSWYYYLEGKITFPFRAQCVATNAVSPLRKGETVEVLRMAIEDACAHDMLVHIRWQGRKMAVSLSQLTAVDPDELTGEAIGDWHYSPPKREGHSERSAIVHDRLISARPCSHRHIK